MSDNPLSSKVVIDTTNFKAGVAELSRQIRVVESGFKAAAAGMGDWDKTSGGLELRIKSLTSSLDLQRQKVDGLQRVYGELAAGGQTSAKEMEELQIKINRETETLNKMQGELTQTQTALDGMGKEAKSAGTNVEQLDKKVKSSDKGFKDLKKNLLEANKAIVTGLLAGVTAAAAGITLLVTRTAETADNLDELSQKTGLSTERLQELQYIAGQAGTDLETMTGSMARLVRSMDAGQKAGSPAALAFAELGIKVTDASGRLRDSKVVWEEAITALGNVQDETERDAVSMQLFGKSAQELNPLILAGAAGMADMAAQAHAMGAVMSDVNVRAAADLNDKLGGLKAGIQGMASTLVSGLIPAVSTTADEFKDWLQSAGMQENFERFGDWLKTDFSGTVRNLADNLLPQLTGGIKLLGDILTDLAEMPAWLKEVVAGILAVGVAINLITANPILAIVAAVAALEIQVITFAKTIDQGYKDIDKALKDHQWEVLKTSKTYDAYIQEQMRAFDVTDKAGAADIRRLEAMGYHQAAIKKFIELTGDLTEEQWNLTKQTYESTKALDDNRGVAEYLTKDYSYLMGASQKVADSQQNARMSTEDFSKSLQTLQSFMSGEMSKAIDDYQKKAYDLENQQWDLNNEVYAFGQKKFRTPEQEAQLNGLYKQLKNIEGALKDNKNSASLQDQKKALEEQVRLLEQIPGKTQAAIDKNEENKKKLGEISSQILQNQQDFDRAQKTIIFNMMLTIASAEAAADPKNASKIMSGLNDIAEAWGLIDDATKTTMSNTQAAFDAWMASDGKLGFDQFYKEYMGLADKTVTITIQEVYSSNGGVPTQNNNATTTTHYEGENAGYPYVWHWDGKQWTKIQKRASGGAANAGSAYWVGEAGPEPFIPRVSGSILSAAGVAGLVDGLKEFASAFNMGIPKLAMGNTAGGAGKTLQGGAQVDIGGIHITVMGNGDPVKIGQAAENGVRQALRSIGAG